MSKNIDERRFALLWVHENALLRWFRAIVSGRVAAARLHGLPDDVEVARVYWDQPRQSWGLVLSSRFYMPVELGRPIPELERVVVDFDTYSGNTRVRVEGEISRPQKVRVSGLVTQRIWQEFLTSVVPVGWKPEEEVEEEGPKEELPMKRPRGRPKKVSKS